MKNRHGLQDAEPTSYGASMMRPKQPEHIKGASTIWNNLMIAAKETPEQRILALELRVQELEKTLRDVIAILAGKY